MSLIESLLKCRVEGNTVFLPLENLPNYADVRKALLNAGATYKKNTFIFPHDAQPYIDRLTGGESVNIKKEFQAFFTPDDIGDWMAQNLFVLPDHKVLEPNGGDGALIRALRREGHKGQVHTFELNPIYSKILKGMDNVVFVADDFLCIGSEYANYFDRIIANPPFNKNQDITHVYKMWECLAPAGRLVTVTSKHWEFANGKKEKAFREWVEENDGITYPLDSGRFKSSGTNVSSLILILDKKA